MFLGGPMAALVDAVLHGATPSPLNTGGHPIFSSLFGRRFKRSDVLRPFFPAPPSPASPRGPTSSGRRASNCLPGPSGARSGCACSSGCQEPSAPTTASTCLVRRGSATLTSPEVAWRPARTRWCEAGHLQGKRMALDRPGSGSATPNDAWVAKLGPGG